MKTAIFLVAAVMMAGSAWAGDVKVGEAKYKAMCVTCHGATGDGKGPASAAMNPKPADFTDAKWQESVTDQNIKDAIRKGGTAVGKSPLMPPLGASMSDAEVDGLVAYLRAMKK